MPMRASKDVARVAIEAIRAQGRRALVSRGWADLALIDMSRPGYAQSGEEAVYVSRLLQATDLMTRQPQ